MKNDKTKLAKEAKNDKASRCWFAYQKKIRQNGIRRNAIRRNATQPKKDGAQTSGAQKPQINTRLYTAYWSRGVAGDGELKADLFFFFFSNNAHILLRVMSCIFRIDIRLLPVDTDHIGRSANPPFTIVQLVTRAITVLRYQCKQC